MPASSASIAMTIAARPALPRMVASTRPVNCRRHSASATSNATEISSPSRSRNRSASSSASRNRATSAAHQARRFRLASPCATSTTTTPEPDRERRPDRTRHDRHLGAQQSLVAPVCRPDATDDRQHAVDAGDQGEQPRHPRRGDRPSGGVRTTRVPSGRSGGLLAPLRTAMTASSWCPVPNIRATADSRRLHQRMTFDPQDVSR